MYTLFSIVITLLLSFIFLLLLVLYSLQWYVITHIITNLFHRFCLVCLLHFLLQLDEEFNVFFGMYFHTLYQKQQWLTLKNVDKWEERERQREGRQFRVILLYWMFRKIRQTDDPLNTFVAGFFAGWASYLSRSSEISGYVVAKVLSSFIDWESQRKTENITNLFCVIVKGIETIFNYLVEKKKIKPLKHGEIWLYSLCTATLFYAGLYEPETLRYTHPKN